MPRTKPPGGRNRRAPGPSPPFPSNSLRTWFEVPQVLSGDNPYVPSPVDLNQARTGDNLLTWIESILTLTCLPPFRHLSVLCYAHRCHPLYNGARAGMAFGINSNFMNLKSGRCNVDCHRINSLYFDFIIFKFAGFFMVPDREKKTFKHGRSCILLAGLRSKRSRIKYNKLIRVWRETNCSVVKNIFFSLKEIESGNGLLRPNGNWICLFALASRSTYACRYFLWWSTSIFWVEAINAKGTKHKRIRPTC